MWSGLISSIPDRWALCNGTNGTPDLRDRFIVGAGSGYAPGNTGGQNTVTLTVNQIPAHGHTGSAAANGVHSHTGSTNQQGSHSHTGSTTVNGSHSHSITVYQTNRYTRGDNTALDRSDTSTGSTGSAGDHNHSLNINNNGDHTHNLNINDGGSHTHNVTVTNTGGGQGCTPSPYPSRTRRQTAPTP